MTAMRRGRRPRRQVRPPRCVSEALLDPDFWLRLAVTPAVFLLLAACLYRSFLYAMGSAAVAGAGLGAQLWLRRRARRREQDLLRRWQSGDPIDDADRNTRRPGDGPSGGMVPDADT